MAASFDLEKEVQTSLAQMLRQTKKIKTRLAEGRPVAHEVSALKKRAAAMARQHEELQERFRSRGDAVNIHGLKIWQRHHEVFSRYQEAMDRILALIDLLPADGSVTAEEINTLHNLLNSILPRKKQRILGALPYRNLNYGAVAARTEPTIVPAYKGGNKVVADPDLVGSPEAPISRPIAELAESLHWNPVEIYQWVKDNIKTEWYWGGMKGAEQTLLQKSGNDADQAALLLALLRSAGFPSRYVRGVIGFFPDMSRAHHLLGIDSSQELATFFQKAGIPFTIETVGSELVIHIEHIWVESFIPTANYRGAVIDEHGKAWLALDTAIKADVSYSSPADTLSAFSFHDLIAGYLDSSRSESFSDYSQAAISDYLASQAPETAYGDYRLSVTVEPELLELLPASLQFTQLAITGEYTTLPDELIHQTRFVAQSANGDIFFDESLPVHQLSNQSIALTYEPETVEDQEVINSYGGLSNTPAYLIRLRPVLTVNGKRLLIGQGGMAAGEDFSFTVELLTPHGPETVENQVTCGNLVVLGLVSQQVVLPEELVNTRKDAERLLFEQALNFIDAWNKAEEEQAALLQLQLSRPIASLITMGGVLDVTYLFDTPHSYTWKGLFVDADLRAAETASGLALNDGSETDSTFMRLAALAGSAEEHRVFEQGFGVDAISTAKVLGLAAEDGIEIITVDSGNMATVLPTLDVPESVREDIENSVNQGLLVRIPASGLSRNSWSGIGYIKEDRLSGEAGYMLSGLLAGGMTTPAPGDWSDYFTRDLLANPFSEAPNTNPDSVTTLKVIHASDFQEGIVGQPLATPLQVIALDKDGLPVQGVAVTFSVKAGGGAFDGGYATKEVTLLTDTSGIAAAPFYLSKSTAENPVYRWMSTTVSHPYNIQSAGNTNSPRVDASIIDAQTTNGIMVASPITALAFPDQPVKMVKLLGDNQSGSILTWLGPVIVSVQDQYDNPVSNVDVTFTVADPVEQTPCAKTNQDNRPGLLVSVLDPCMGQVPVYGECGSPELTFKSSDQGSPAQVMLGGMADALYKVTARGAGLQQAFNASSLPFGNCDDESFPEDNLVLKSIYLADDNGQTINAGQVGSSIPLQARMYFVSEGVEERDVTFSCSPDKTCPVEYGSRTYSINTDFVSDSLTFDGQQASGGADTVGLYSLDYQVPGTPGKHTVAINGSASTYFHTIPDVCTSCDEINEELSLDASASLEVYAVEVKTEPSLVVPVDPDGVLACDLRIDYEILPADYSAGSAYVVISDGEQELFHIPGELQGQGFVTLSRGFPFDTDKQYSATVVLNYGAGYSEIRSRVIPFELGQITIDALSLQDGKHSVMQGSDEVLLARTTPADREVTYEIVAVTEEVEAKIFAGNKIRALANSNNGYATVKVADAEFPCIYELIDVPIGCQSCAGDAGVMCKYNAKFNNGSIDAVFNIGAASNGGSAGSLILRAKQPSTLLAQPQALRFSSLAGGETEVVLDPSGTVAQLIGPASLADIKVLSPFSYQISLYPIAAKGDMVDGRYEIDQASVPITSWTIENPAQSEVDFATLRITEQRGKTYVTEYIWDDASNAWTLSQGNGQQVDSKSQSYNLDGDRVVTRTISDSQGVVASKTVTTYHYFPWGEEIIAKVVDPDSTALTTTYSYYEDSNQLGSFSRLHQVTNPDGSWQRTEYDELGRPVREISNWLDAPATASASEARMVSYDYTSVDPGDLDAPRFRMSPRTTTETILGTVVSKSFKAFVGDGLLTDRQEISEQCTTPTCSYGSADNLRTVTTYYLSNNVDLTTMRVHPSSGKVKSVLSSDGQLTSYSYETGTFTMAGTPDQWTFTPDDGWDSRQIVTYGTEASPAGIAGKTTRSIIISNRYKQTLFNETQVYTGSAYERLNWSANTLDDLGRVAKVERSDGTYTETTWGCCSKDSETDSQGNTTTFEYDNLRRLVSQERRGPNLSAITTDFIYDAAGRRTEQTVIAGTLSQTSSSSYDSAGRLQSSTDASGLTTSYSYSADGLIAKVIRPGGATEITEKYPDGQLKSVTGTGVIAQYYSYSVNADGSRTSKTNSVTATSPRWQQTTADMAGRTIRSEQPGANGAETTENIYDDLGRLVRIVTTGQPDRLYTYDELGNQIASGLDLDKSGSLEEASSDRISATASQYVKIGSDWWLESSSQVFAVTDDATATTVASQRSRLTGLGASGLISESVSIDIHGNQTVSRSYLDRASRTVTSEVSYPDSAVPARQVTVGGYLQSAASKTDITTTFAYDDLGRRISTTDPRTGSNTTHYDDKGRVDYVEDAAGNRTSFGYDQNTGRKISQTNAEQKSTFFSYDDLGRITHTWGSGSYPVRYVYDDYGQRSQMHTFRTDSGWDTPIWPATTGTADITTWHYDEATGLLVAKEDAQNNQVSYTYTTAGRLQSRAWARAGGSVTTSYEYDPQTSELTSIDYSDTTPDISFSYDRLGRQASVNDGLGERTFTYTPSLQLDSEVIVGGAYSTTLTRQYDTLVPGRNKGIILDSNYQVTYSFDELGRFDSLSWQQGTTSGSSQYTYLADSNLLASVSSEAGGVVYSTSYSYEAKRNLKTVVSNKADATTVSDYLYEYDALGRRKNVKNSGMAFSAEAFSAYGYNDRNELTSSERYLGTDIADTSQPVSDEKRAYQYDAIGNRELASLGDGVGQQDIDYTANALNQYEQVTGGAITDLSYDEDGNLIGYSKDGKQLNLTFNAENRLVAVEPVTPGVGDSKSEFGYDYMGRRVSKVVSSWDGSGWQFTDTGYFIYDGWNLIAELDETGQTEVGYVWGLDLSQSLQGAGGIGGLIARVDVAQEKTHFYAYDGNGNVGQLIDADDGSLAAAYEYDPYGNVVKAVGALADVNPFRFSTKYFDPESGFYYYGYRYYVPELGRWVNRDPLGEEGGINLYGFVGNDGVNNFDPYGYYDFDMHYLATFAALKATGMSNSEAWHLAYFSAIPDIDKRYDAINNAPNRIMGDDWSRDVMEILHQLNGMSLDKIKRFRKCLRCLIMSTYDPDEKGVMLHVLGDTYGHLKVKYNYDIVEEDMLDGFYYRLKGYGFGDKTYSGPFGHAFDGHYPDVVAIRKDLGAAYLNDVYTLFGGKDSGPLAGILDKIDSLDTKTNAYENIKDYVDAKGYFQGLDPDVEEYDPRKGEKYNQMTIEKLDQMKNIVSRIKGKCLK